MKSEVTLLGEEDGSRAGDGVGVGEGVGRGGDDGEDKAGQPLGDVSGLFGADLGVLRLTVGNEGDVVVARVALLRGEAEGGSVASAGRLGLEREGRELLDRSGERGSLATGVGDDDANGARGGQFWVRCWTAGDSRRSKRVDLSVVERRVVGVGEARGAVDLVEVLCDIRVSLVLRRRWVRRTEAWRASTVKMLPAAARYSLL